MPSTESRAPIKSTGSLNQYKSFTVTPKIGTEFSDLQLTSILENDTLIRDLAVEVSRRGVVFFRNQDITDDQQQFLGQRLGELTGKPSESTLHVHPAKDLSKPAGKEILEIQPEGKSAKELALKHGEDDTVVPTVRASRGWHTDITFEPVPSDYAILKLLQIPENGGGDTLWASGYEAYEQLSPYYQELLEKLTAVHSGQFFEQVVSQRGDELYDQPRGNPANVGNKLVMTHPVIRTNPVTGWKSVFVNPGFTKKIVGVTPDESASLLDLLFRNLSQGHDAQVRFKWHENDVAIWDNRSTFHSATFDTEAGDRLGHRVLSIGEKPYLDVNSKGYKAALEEEKLEEAKRKLEGLSVGEKEKTKVAALPVEPPKVAV
ncbi:Alpha-ketoglutarate-dependent taurine dioxygenase [Yarrowia sp. C11]|nr:Alpha-ketoglutarate-dependent taurine dioxygenase [Yarrowia sp. E02]KAG5367662.1 Alpha-ketoglutarate-dependent taurine dioxygenase [Yarrowia sp. C11]